MIPPYQQRGQPISPSAFNMLIDLVRSSLLTAINGGTFQRSISGTNINIGPSSALTSTGSGGGAVCEFFEVTDASEDTVLKVEVAQNLIAGRYPDGMGLGFPPFKLEISGNSYIYAAIYWDVENLEIGADPDAISILQSEELLVNTSTLQYILIATVQTGGTPLKITTITNVCSEPVPNPCVLDWSA